MTGKTASRRTAAQVEEAIKEAVRGELEDRGYWGVTFEGVAKRAGTSKPVVYRRYSSRASMVLEVVIPEAFTVREVADTGSLRGDIWALCAEIIDNLKRPGVDVLRGLMAEVDERTIARLAQLSDNFAKNRIGTAIDRARERGELGKGEVSPRVAGSLVALVRHETFFTGGIPSDESIAQIVDEIYVPLLVHVTRA